MTYLECVVKETLRFYTTIPAHERTVEEDITIGKLSIVQYNFIYSFIPSKMVCKSNYIFQIFKTIISEKINQVYLYFLGILSGNYFIFYKIEAKSRNDYI